MRDTVLATARTMSARGYDRLLKRRWRGRCVPVMLLLWLASSAWAGQNVWTAYGNLDTPVNAIVSHPQEDILYAAGDGGVYRSVDGGDWVLISDGLAASTVLTLAVDQEDGKRLYAGLNAGLYASPDGGASWALVDTVGPGVLSLATGADGLVYAGTLGRGDRRPRLPVGRAALSDGARQGGGHRARRKLPLLRDRGRRRGAVGRRHGPRLRNERA